MAPIHGWGTTGKRLRAYAPHGHWRTLTFVAALHCDRIVAPCVFDGPNEQSFRAWVDRQLLAAIAPAISSSCTICAVTSPPRSAGPSAPVGLSSGICRPTPLTSIPSNRSSRRSSTGCEWPSAGTVEDTWPHIGRLVQSIPPTEYRDYFADAGYAAIHTCNDLDRSPTGRRTSRILRAGSDPPAAHRGCDPPTLPFRALWKAPARHAHRE